jgi:nicotinate-nucleotide pyrophosphorylase (carboxylating)
MAKFTAHLKKAVRDALAEDRAGNDITSRLLIPAGLRAGARIIVKEPAIVCGMMFAAQTFRAVDPGVKFKARCKDGARVGKNTCVATLEGPARAILAGERTALNFLGYLSGIATQTGKFVAGIRPYKAQILATRKTTPGNRIIEKYAVTAGGGGGHRAGLADMILIKDNHHIACRDRLALEEAVKLARKRTKLKVEVEVDNLNELKPALEACPDMVLLDNMTIRQLERAVKIVKGLPPRKRPLLEASGGVILKTVRRIARAGVDRISVGALTHSHKAIDVSLEFIGR